MFEAKLELRDRADILRLRGELALASVKDLKSVIRNLEGRGAHPLVVDMSALRFLDSYGASILVGMDFKYKGKPIVLAGPSREIKNVLVRLFILDRFAVRGSVKEALRGLEAAKNAV